MLLPIFLRLCIPVLSIIIAAPVMAQTAKEPMTKKEWSAPYQPFRIVGNLYYVGTEDLACYLITTKEGHVLINTGLAASGDLLKKNIETLGFKWRDIKVLLTSQAHYDHVGAMAQIKKETSALLMANEKDAEVLRSCGASDYELGKYGVSFEPVQPDRLLQDGDTISLGGLHIVMLHHPGHTKGSSSFSFAVRDAKKSYRVLIANLPTIIVNEPFTAIKGYPNISKDYAYTLAAMKDLKFDIWLAAHGSQFNLHDKHKPGAVYRPEAFADQKGYDTAMAHLQKQYEQQLKKR